MTPSLTHMSHTHARYLAPWVNVDSVRLRAVGSDSRRCSQIVDTRHTRHTPLPDDDTKRPLNVRPLVLTGARTTPIVTLLLCQQLVTVSVGHPAVQRLPGETP
jgi:hypothetical protein